jgi:hypothetical protein
MAGSIPGLTSPGQSLATPPQQSQTQAPQLPPPQPGQTFGDQLAPYVFPQISRDQFQAIIANPWVDAQSKQQFLNQFLPKTIVDQRTGESWMFRPGQAPVRIPGNLPPMKDIKQAPLVSLPRWESQTTPHQAGCVGKCQAAVVPLSTLMLR